MSKSGPTVYLYEATKNQIASHEMKRKDSPFKIRLTRIIQPTTHSFRVAMQAGWHTVHRIHPGRDGKERIIALDKMEFHEARITRFKIDPSSGPKVRRELAEMGIHSGTAYGDLQSVCASIRADLGVED